MVLSFQIHSHFFISTSVTSADQCIRDSTLGSADRRADDEQLAKTTEPIWL